MPAQRPYAAWILSKLIPMPREHVQCGRKIVLYFARLSWDTTCAAPAVHVHCVSTPLFTPSVVYFFSILLAAPQPYVSPLGLDMPSMPNAPPPKHP